MEQLKKTPIMAALFEKSPIIVVASSKGGVGKSFVATNVAVDIANKKTKTLLIDAEKDGTTMDWQQIENEYLTVISGYDKNLPQMLDIYRQSFGAIVVDTAGVNAAIDDSGDENLQEYLNKKILCKADLVIVPLLPAPTDIRKTIRFISNIEHYVDASRGNLKALLFLNKAREQEKLTKEVIALGDQFAIPLSKNTIRRTTEIEQSEAEFKSINEYLPNSKAAEEMRALQAEAISMINGSTQG